MYRNTLMKIDTDNRYKYLESMWAIEIPGLVRVPFYDSQDKECGYVVYYSEVEQTYGLIKYNLLTGRKLWTSRIVNGGYGTPVVWENVVVVLKGFCGLAAFNKYNGELVWEFESSVRIRSSLNIIDNMLTFSSGGSVYQLNLDGEVVFKLDCPNTFLFGTISKQHDHLIAIGTRFDSVTNQSNLYLFGLMKNNSCLFEINLGQSHVISSDTSGFVVVDDVLFITCATKIYSISANTGEVLWVAEVEGDCGRHICVTDKKYVFYTTINGIYGALDYVDGRKVWRKKSNENCIVAPPTVYGKNLLILADSYLMNLDKEDGSVLQMISIGHVPYSACTIYNGYILVGGGEPPVNGLLRAFKIKYEIPKYMILGHFESGNFIENNEMEINIIADADVHSLALDASEFSSAGIIYGRKKGGIYNFLIPLNPNIVGGYYSLPLLVNAESDYVLDSISIYMFRKMGLPIKHIIPQFNKEIKQQDIFNSGSAIYQMVMKEYGKDITQTEFRKIIDYVKQKSKWEDADFQTWRLIMKRVLSSPAKTLDEFIRLENEYESML